MWKGATNVLAGSSGVQKSFTLAVAFSGVALAWACAELARVDWAIWQWALVMLAAFDLCGGIIAMCLPPAIRKLRRSGLPWRPILFTALHIHPFLLGLAFPDASWTTLFITYAAALIGVSAVTIVPAELRAGVVLAWCAGTLGLMAAVGGLPGLEWFGPAYMLKLVGSHTVTATGASQH